MWFSLANPTNTADVKRIHSHRPSRYCCLTLKPEHEHALIRFVFSNERKKSFNVRVEILLPCKTLRVHSHNGFLEIAPPLEGFHYVLNSLNFDVIVIPETNMVVTFTSNNYASEDAISLPLNLLVEYIVPALDG